MADTEEEYRRSYNADQIKDWHREAGLWLEMQNKFAGLFLTSLILLSGGGITAIISLSAHAIETGSTLPAQIPAIYTRLVVAALAALASAGLAFLYPLLLAVAMNNTYTPAGFFLRSDSKLRAMLGYSLQALAVLAGVVAFIALLMAFAATTPLISEVGTDAPWTR